MELIPGSFVDPAGDDCPVLTIQELVSDAKGVAIVTQEMAKDLRSDSTNLSVDSLAVVTIGELPADTSDRVTAVQRPAVYKPTSEPILVSGSLCSLEISQLNGKSMRVHQRFRSSTLQSSD